MLEDIEKVRLAFDLKSVVPEEASVTVKDNRLLVRNPFLKVSHPVDCADFAVAAVSLDKATRGIPNRDKATLKATPKQVIITSELGRSQLDRTIGWEGDYFTRPDIPVNDVPPHLDVALREIIPFTIGDGARAWTGGARFDEDLATATNGMVLLQVGYPSGFRGVTVPRVVLKFLEQRLDDLEAWGCDDKRILLDFKDGGWAVATTIQPSMPQAAVGMVDKLSFRDLPEVTDVFRTEVRRAAERTDKFLTITKDEVTGARSMSSHVVELSEEVAMEGEALFGAKDFLVVMNAAQHMDVSSYPNPIPFLTRERNKGLLAGLRKPT